jgi:hypothetical protein
MLDQMLRLADIMRVPRSSGRSSRGTCLDCGDIKRAGANDGDVEARGIPTVLQGPKTSVSCSRAFSECSVRSIQRVSPRRPHMRQDWQTIPIPLRYYAL